MNEERPGLDITVGTFSCLISFCIWLTAPQGTLPYMSIEMLDTSLSLERGDPSARHLRLDEVLHEAIVVWLTGQSCNEYTLRDRFATFGTRGAFSTKILPCLSPYFKPMGVYLEKIRQLIYGDTSGLMAVTNAPQLPPPTINFSTSFTTR